jgi:hypothetical protein
MVRVDEHRHSISTSVSGPSHYSTRWRYVTGLPFVRRTVGLTVLHSAAARGRHEHPRLRIVFTMLAGRRDAALRANGAGLLASTGGVR